MTASARTPMAIPTVIDYTKESSKSDVEILAYVM
jgi:hypothetical protein